MKNNKSQSRNYAFLVGIMVLSLIAKLDAADASASQLEEESTRIIQSAVTKEEADESVIKLTYSSKEAHVCAIKGPQISGTKESMVDFLNFIKRLLVNQNEAIKIHLTRDTGTTSTHTVIHRYGPYNETKSKSWYSETGSLGQKEFETTLDKALKNPEEECTIIWYQDSLVLGTGKYVNAYDSSGKTISYSQFYDLKISE